jgi:outer membrane murein-binding lipoprotein Lpp
MLGRDPLAGRVDRLEGDHRALLIAFGAAFVIIIGAFAAGYIALAAKIDAGFAQSAQRTEGLSSNIAELKTDVAILRERSEQRAPSSADR